MKNIYKILTSILVFLWVFTISFSVLGAPTANIFRTILPETDSLYDLGSNGVRWANIYSDNLDTTTLVIGGSSTGNIIIKKADPTLIYDVTTATDTDFWVGVQDDGLGTDDDKYQIGDGLTPGTNPFLTILTSGNVGIGTTTPTTKLDVNGYIEVYNSDTAVGQIGLWDGTTGFNISNGVLANDTLTISNYTTRPMSGNSNAFLAIKSTGNVGIGTTAPTTQLEVMGPTNGATLRIVDNATDLRRLDLTSPKDSGNTPARIQVTNTGADLGIGLHSYQDLI